ncbi:MAG: 4Fe-4S ferredoxin [Ignavibacteriales bacterium]
MAEKPEVLQNYLFDTALNNGAQLTGCTMIRKVEPVIILGFPYMDGWFLKYPYLATKRLGEEYMVSRQAINSLCKILQSEGYSAAGKSVLSMWGDFRPLAVAAGLGDWGRNGLVVNKEHGSKLLFAAVFTDAPLQPTSPDTSGQTTDEHSCDDCEECVRSCPARAFEGQHFNAYRCMAKVMKGCSDCLQSCQARTVH